MNLQDEYYESVTWVGKDFLVKSPRKNLGWWGFILLMSAGNIVLVVEKDVFAGHLKGLGSAFYHFLALQSFPR